MAIDPPARIAVLGAGPLGLEAALYARFLGYDVDVYERGEVAESVRRWGHVRMFSPFQMNASPLGLAALAAQDKTYRAPGPDELLTGQIYAERYLLPLSQTDLLSDHLHLGTRVVGIARRGRLKDRPVGPDARVDGPFDLLLENRSGEQRATADVVIDATGTYCTPRWIGAGGIPALGERQWQESLRYHLPDVLGADREQFAGKRTLVVGSGYSAATTIVALAALAEHQGSGEILWLTRRVAAPPIVSVDDDPLSSRRELTAAANRLATNDGGLVQHLAGGTIERISRQDDGVFEVEIGEAIQQVVRVDQVVAQVGYRPDDQLARELQVRCCHVTEGPASLAAALSGSSVGDAPPPAPTDIQALLTTEPRYFVLGSKSYGRNSQFLISHGLDQIRSVFSFLADRHDLDLYANMQRLLP